MGIETILSTGLGLAGLLQNGQAQNAQQNAMGDANALNWEALNWQKDLFKKFSEPALQQLLGLAANYDPVAESRAGTDYAKGVAQESLDKVLHAFNARYAAGGGTPGNSSLEGAQRSAVMKPIASQLAGLVADAQSNATAKKMGAWQAVLGQAPAGSLGQSYFAAADNLARMASAMPGGDFGGSSRLLADALANLFKRSNTPNGGSGDNRYYGFGGNGNGGFGNSGFGGGHN